MRRMRTRGRKHSVKGQAEAPMLITPGGAKVDISAYRSTTKELRMILDVVTVAQTMRPRIVMWHSMS
jgi:hypothetical protein